MYLSHGLFLFDSLHRHTAVRTLHVPRHGQRFLYVLLQLFIVTFAIRVPRQIQRDPWEHALPKQADCVWLEVGHLDLEVLVEVFRNSRQVFDGESLLAVCWDVTLM